MAAMVLADLGADVIRIDKPKDDSRAGPARTPTCSIGGAAPSVVDLHQPAAPRSSGAWPGRPTS